jgi:hypothetical protein
MLVIRDEDGDSMVSRNFVSAYNSHASTKQKTNIDIIAQVGLSFRNCLL